jgi:hypothetical protein
VTQLPDGKDMVNLILGQQIKGFWRLLMVGYVGPRACELEVFLEEKDGCCE